MISIQPSDGTKFLVIWFGQLISIIGSGMTSFGLGIWVYQSTGSISRFAFVSVCFTLPAILIAPLAGVLADRISRRTVMLLSDLAAGLSTLGLAVLFFTGHLGLWEICVLVCIESIADAFRLVSYTAIISQLVPGQYVTRAAGMMQFGPAAAQVLAPALAAILISMIRLQGVLLVDFLTFIFALGTLIAIRVPALTRERIQSSFLRDAVDGWRFIAVRPGLIALLFFFFFINLTLSFIQVLLPPVVLAFTTAKVLGTIMSASSLGFLGGSILMSIWGGPQKRVHGLLGAALMYALGTLLTALAPSPFLITAATLVLFFQIPVMNSCSQAIWQLKTPIAMQGRVFSTRMMLAWSSIPLAAFLAGPLADHVLEPLLASRRPLGDTLVGLVGSSRGRGAALLLILNGMFALLIATACFFNRHLRSLDDDRPVPVSYGEDMARV